MEQTKDLIPKKLDLDDTYMNEGLKVLIHSPLHKGIKAEIIIPYDPEDEEDLDVEEGDVFWCRRLDGKLWDKGTGDSVRFNGDWLAIHRAYIFEHPKKGDWDSEENSNG